MQTGDEPFDNGASDQFERAYAREDFGCEKSSSDLLRVVLDHTERLNRDLQDVQDKEP